MIEEAPLGFMMHRIDMINRIADRLLIEDVLAPGIDEMAVAVIIEDELGLTVQKKAIPAKGKPARFKWASRVEGKWEEA